MSTLPDDISGEDMFQWLRGTWFLADGRPLYYRGGGPAVLDCTTTDGEPYAVRRRDVRLWWPQTGAINIPDVGALYVQRSPARQWRRSYSARELTVLVPHSWAVARLHPDSQLLMIHADSGMVVEALFSPVYYPADVARDMLTTLPSVALNRACILVQVSHSEVAVYWAGQMVGHLEPDGTFVADGDTRQARRAARLLGGKK